MSGRLIITNKKSYTPWNSKNVERALRDERIQREKEEKRELAARQKRNEERILWMKQQTCKESDKGLHCKLHGEDVAVQSSDESMELRHVNLFEEEEKRCLDVATTASTTDEIQQTSRSRGIMPVYLVETRKEEEQINDLFYKRKDILRKDVDDKLKQRLDPMTAYYRTAEKIDNDKKCRVVNSSSGALPRSRSDLYLIKEGSTGQREKIKEHRKRDREDQQQQHHDQQQQKSTRHIDELRQRRLKRESLEKQRETDLR